MKLIAKDFTNKTGLLDAVLEISGKFIDTPRISIVGIPDLSIPTQVKQLKFRLLPKDTELEVPEMPSTLIEQAFCWVHTEARISNDDSDAGTAWMSEKTLLKVIESWSELDGMLRQNKADFDDYFSKSSSDKISKYTVTREDLMLLLSLRGGSTLRQIVLTQQQNQSPFDLMKKLFSAHSHRLLNKTPYITSVNYAVTIKAMGERINLFIARFNSHNPKDRQMLGNQISHDLKLLSDIFYETDCIGIANDMIDVGEAATSLMLIKDMEHTCSIGAAILKPLGMLFASTVINSVWSVGLESTLDYLSFVDREIAYRYKILPENKKPSFLGVTNE